MHSLAATKHHLNQLKFKVKKNMKLKKSWTIASDTTNAIIWSTGKDMDPKIDHGNQKTIWKMHPTYSPITNKSNNNSNEREPRLQDFQLPKVSLDRGWCREPALVLAGQHVSESSDALNAVMDALLKKKKDWKEKRKERKDQKNQKICKSNNQVYTESNASPLRN